MTEIKKETKPKKGKLIFFSVQPKTDNRIFHFATMPLSCVTVKKNVENKKKFTPTTKTLKF